MILGILGLLCCGFFTGIPALILGNQAKQEIAGSGGTQSGDGMAKAGVILGIIAIVLGVLGVIFYDRTDDEPLTWSPCALDQITMLAG